MTILSGVKKTFLSRDELAIQVERLKSEGLVVGFTSGAFDLIHHTHIRVLEEAHEYCDVLIVGINSDSSIKKYKGNSRPIKSEFDRAMIIGSIKYVDYFFVFDEENNNENIKALKPNLYIKGGDYKKQNLSSNSLVEKFGGKTVILDWPTPINTTSIIDTVLAKEIPQRMSEEHIYDGLALIDRDGVINKEVEYLHRVKDFEFIDGSIEAIRRLNDKNIAVVVVTNQPGVGVGLYTEDDLFLINSHMIKQIHKNKAHIDRLLYCPDMHSDSSFKKPNSGMIKEALSQIRLSSDANVYMFGDRRSDSLSAKNSGFDITTYGVLTGKSLGDVWVEHTPDFTNTNLLSAVMSLKC